MNLIDAIRQHLDENWGRDFNEKRWDRYFEAALLSGKSVHDAQFVAETGEEEHRRRMDADDHTSTVLMVDDALREIVKMANVVYVAPDGKKYKFVEDGA